MNYLEIEPSVIHLQGITRSSSFRIINRNDFLAVSFSLIVEERYSNLLKVFPDQGILLGGEQQKIRVKLNSDDNSSADSIEVTYPLHVKFTYKTQYNKRYLVKNNMSGWNQLSKDVFEKEIRIISGGEKEAIQNYIKEKIAFEQKFAPQELNLSAIKFNQANEPENQSFLNLDISSRVDDSKIKDLQRRPTSLKLNSSLEVDKIIPLDFGESRTKQDQLLIKRISSKKLQKSEGIIESKIIPEDLSKSFSISMKTAQKNSFSQEGSLFNNSSQGASKHKTLDLVILAIISAFFVALGNNIKRIIS